MAPVKLFFELGRSITGPYGYLVTKVRHIKNTYKSFAGLDACMVNLMRPALYGAYHHITVVGKENAQLTKKYDVTGSLCENNDKFFHIFPLFTFCHLLHLYCFVLNNLINSFSLIILSPNFSAFLNLEPGL